MPAASSGCASSAACARLVTTSSVAKGGRVKLTLAAFRAAATTMYRPDLWQCNQGTGQQGRVRLADRSESTRWSVGLRSKCLPQR